MEKYLKHWNTWDHSVSLLLIFQLIKCIKDSTTLSNGVVVCTEKTPGATSFIGVYVGAGSRNEDLSTSGTSYLLQKMLTKGTSKLSKSDFSREIS